MATRRRASPGSGARFWGHEPQADSVLLTKGFHVVYCDVAEMFGNEKCMGIWDRFYKALRSAGFAKKAAMFGFSRGDFTYTGGRPSIRIA